MITVLCSQFEMGIFLLRILHNLYEAAKKAEELRRSQRHSEARMHFSLKELDWFSQNAYNCAVKGCENWENKHIINITDSCLKVSVPQILLSCSS